MLFSRYMVYGNFKDFLRTMVSDRVLHYKIFLIAINPQYDGYQRGLASMVWKYFDKNAWDTSTHQDQKKKCLRIRNWLMSWITQPLENFEDARYTHLIEIIFQIVILQTWNLQKSKTGNSDSCCLLLIFRANTPGLFC